MLFCNSLFQRICQKNKSLDALRNEKEGGVTTKKNPQIHENSDTNTDDVPGKLLNLFFN